MVSFGIRCFDVYSNQVTETRGLVDASIRWNSSSTWKEDDHGRSATISKCLQDQGLQTKVTDIIINTWKEGTSKQYQLVWKRWVLWCNRTGNCATKTSEVTVITYLYSLFKDRKFYSVINTPKAMVLQTFTILGNKWCSNQTLISCFMKDVFAKKLLLPKYKFTRDVSVVLKLLSSWFPLQTLSLKQLTLKLIALIALATAPRAQTLKSLNLDYMKCYENYVIFYFPNLLKSSQPG